MNTAAGMVEAGLGIALLPALGVDLEAHPRVRSRKLPKSTFTRQIALTRKRDKTVAPGAEAFIARLSDFGKLRG